MSKWSGFYKIVKLEPDVTKVTDSQEIGDQGSYGNYTWYQRLVQGSAARLTRYREYDLMDNDIEISRALDTIAEEMTGNNPKTDEPLELDIENLSDDNSNSTVVVTLKTVLNHWSKLHDWENRLFKIARYTVKYGDCFFKKKDLLTKWIFVHPKDVVSALVNHEDVTDVQGWQVKEDLREAKTSYGVPISGTGTMETQTEILEASEVVRFTLNDDMSESAPFGESVLRPVYRAHKQKELLEDAIIIYRIQRAPERRVFYIDVGKMPPNRIKQYLEQIKNEIKQKKIPSPRGGQSEIDSVYNPQSMSEDFFLAQRADGRGSKVETLPGGQGLGELTDLEYFQDKVFRGLRIPVSYTKQGAEGSVFNDGKVGVAYIQELRFALYVQRLQGALERILDSEFKKYLKYTNIKIDNTTFRIRLPEPSNFGTYRQQEVDAALLGIYGSADAVPYLAKRFAMKRYLQLTDEEILENEHMKLEELGLDPQKQPEGTMTKIYAPDTMAPDLGGGLGGGDLGAGMLPSGDLGGELGGELGATPGEPGAAPGLPAPGEPGAKPPIT